MSLKNITKKLIKENDVRVAQEAETAKLNQEMIAYQNDKPFIDAATAAIQNIFDNCGVNNSNINKGEGAKAIKALEDIFTKRFGVKVIFGSNDYNTFYTMPTSKTIGYDLNWFKDMYGSFATLDNMKEKNPELYEKLVNGTIDFDNPKYKDAYRWYEDLSNASYYSLLAQIKKTNITLDIKNAKIVNPPKQMSFYINADWYFASDSGTTPMEMLAILLHEFGHNWYELEGIVNLYANVVVLNDIIREEYGKKGKTPADTLRIFYNKTKLDMPKNIPNDMATATIQAYKDIYRGSMYQQESIGFFTNDEQQADEFSARFGLGRYMVSALQKLYPNMEDYDQWTYSPARLNFDISFGVMVTIFTSTLLTMSLGGTIAALIFAAPIGVVLGVLLTITSIVSTMKNTYGVKGSIGLYDDLNRRYKRIRNTTIRRLNYVEDVNVKTAVLKDIEELDKTIQPVLAAAANSKLRKLVDFFAKDKEGYQEQKLNELLEDLNANEIHVAANLFKTLKV